jgi:hypothetical protein
VHHIDHAPRDRTLGQGQQEQQQQQGESAC